MCAHHPDDGRVAAKDHQIEEEKEEKEESLEMGGGGEHAKHELSGAGLIEDGAPSKHVSCRRRTESPDSSWAEQTYCLSKIRDFRFCFRYGSFLTVIKCEE